MFQLPCLVGRVHSLFPPRPVWEWSWSGPGMYALAWNQLCGTVMGCTRPIMRERASWYFWWREALPRSLSEIRLIYCGGAGFGHIFRSFSLNSPNYSPQTIEKFVSNRHHLVTITNFGQTPSRWDLWRARGLLRSVHFSSIFCFYLFV